MSWRVRTKVALPAVAMLLVFGAAVPGQAEPGQAEGQSGDDEGRSPALCGPDDSPGDSCVPQRRRPESLGWAYDAAVTEVTRDRARRVSRLELAINTPEFCEERQASGHNPWVSYHSIDDPTDAHLAMLSFGTAGLRVFDVRNPRRPVEVAYFNHGALVHAGVSHYDAARGLIYVPGGDGFQVLEIQPQVRERLGL